MQKNLFLDLAGVGKRGDLVRSVRGVLMIYGWSTGVFVPRDKGHYLLANMLPILIV
jgi:hypothetical protein